MNKGIIICSVRHYIKDIFENESIRGRATEVFNEQSKASGIKMQTPQYKDDYVVLTIDDMCGKSPSKIAQRLKGCVSLVLRQEFPEVRKSDSLWNRGYIFSETKLTDEEITEKLAKMKTERIYWKKRLH